MFTPTISVEFRKALILEMNANTWAAIMDDNPGEFSIRLTTATRKESRSRQCPPTSWLHYRGCRRTSSIGSWDAI